MFLTHLRDHLGIKGVRRVVMHEPLSNLRKVIFLQFAQGTPRTEVWRGLQGASTLLADCGKIVHRGERGRRSAPTPTRCSGRSPIAPTRSRTCTSCRTARPATGRSPGRAREESTLLIDATLKHAAPPLALPAREFMERARAIWEELQLPRAHAAAAVARLLARRLGGPLGRLRRRARRRANGKQNGAETFARRRGGAHAGDAGARGGGEEVATEGDRASCAVYSSPACGGGVALTLRRTPTPPPSAA